MNKYKIFSWSAVILSVWLLILPRIIPICNGLSPSGSPMNCHYAYQAEFIVMLLAVILAAALLVLRTAEARLLTGFIIILLAIIMIILPEPWAIGICEDGACQKTTFFATISASLLALAGAGIVWLTWKSKDD